MKGHDLLFIEFRLDFCSLDLDPIYLRDDITDASSKAGLTSSDGSGRVAFTVKKDSIEFRVPCPYLIRIFPYVPISSFKISILPNR